LVGRVTIKSKHLFVLIEELPMFALSYSLCIQISEKEKRKKKVVILYVMCKSCQVNEVKEMVLSLSSMALRSANKIKVIEHKIPA
jgi:hypothetical protein